MRSTKDIVPLRRLSKTISKVGVEVVRGSSDTIGNDFPILFVTIPEVVVHKAKVGAENRGLVGVTIHNNPFISLSLVQKAKQPPVLGGVLLTGLKRVELRDKIVGGDTRRVGVLDKERVGGSGTGQFGVFEVGVLAGDGLEGRNTNLVRVGDHGGRTRVLNISDILFIIMRRMSIQNQSTNSRSPRESFKSMRVHTTPQHSINSKPQLVPKRQKIHTRVFCTRMNTGGGACSGSKEDTVFPVFFGFAVEGFGEVGGSEAGAGGVFGEVDAEDLVVVGGGGGGGVRKGKEKKRERKEKKRKRKKGKRKKRKKKKRKKKKEEITP